MSIGYVIVMVLLIIGGLNWGVIGVAAWNGVAAIFGGDQPGAMTIASRAVYIAVGIAAILAIPMLGARAKKKKTAE